MVGVAKKDHKTRGKSLEKNIFLAFAMEKDKKQAATEQ